MNDEAGSDDGKCDHMHVREAVVEQLNHVDHGLAVQVAEGVGVKPPAGEVEPNHAMARMPKERRLTAIISDTEAGADQVCQVADLLAAFRSPTGSRRTDRRRARRRRGE